MIAFMDLCLESFGLSNNANNLIYDSCLRPLRVLSPQGPQRGGLPTMP